jgi:hypothetical protein
MDRIEKGQSNKFEENQQSQIKEAVDIISEELIN